ncbi:hypothetical protein DMUE_2601 [Dictyocoela muelleri]|nr:hypothetical protein DMUE_2601 [Dictyocoela muelleri]
MNRIQEEIESIRTNISTDEKIEQASFKYRNEMTGLEMIHKINLLKSIEQQDVLSWSYTFKEISRICNWTTDAQLEVLKHIVSIDIQYNIGAPINPDAYLNLLIKQKYNHEMSYKYYEKLFSLRQNSFYTIRKYLREIELNCQKLGLCLDWNNNLILQKQQEIFFNGLDPNTKLELSKYFKKDFKSVYESITTTESILIENIQVAISNSKYDDYHEKVSKGSYETRNHKYKKNDNKTKKFCSFHNTSTHSNDECRVLARKKNLSKDKTPKDNEKILALQEPKPIVKSILIPIAYDDKK